ncbi:gluconolactonase [Thraustotheca clavata]|uniref:Gluconolactonase n=1 Tax=Thraustotheca clavata TaxID=74557 RepID=A0A1W0A5B9_9STRA|nr:gluconolactonase [Thraustotheca clavata]
MSHRPRRCAEANTVYLLGGTGQRGCRDGKASSATFNAPTSLVALNNGTLAITDSQNNTMRFITLDGASDASVVSLRNSPFLAPRGLDVVNNTLYVCDTGHHTIKYGLAPENFVEDMDFGVLAGTGKRGLSDGPAVESSFHNPSGICVKDNELFVADTGNHCIRRIYQQLGAWHVNTVAGGSTVQRTTPTGRRSASKPNTPQAGCVNGIGRQAMFRAPSGITLGPLGELFVADTFNHTIRVVYWAENEKAWLVETIAGNTRSGHIDGAARHALFNQPVGVCIAADRTLLVSDKGNNCIRQLGGGNQNGSYTHFSWVRTITIDQLAKNWHFSKGIEPPFLLPKGLCMLRNSHQWHHNRNQSDCLFVGVCDTGNHLIRILSLESTEVPQDDEDNQHQEAESNVSNQEKLQLEQIQQLTEENQKLKQENAKYQQLLQMAIARVCVYITVNFKSECIDE